jgi:chaperone BCS1
MDRNTPSQELAKHMTASASPNTGSLFAHISENPFFTAVRSILAVGVALVCSQVP